ncbi:MAG: disulfide bond formation protein B, partial [Gammaproteobacteria bacterium]|nr:disulfide bond formation protein B [Gammaproteobacteria bacterium]
MTVAVPSPLLQPRLLFLLMFIGCCGLLGFGYFLQFARHLEPCPLC